MWLHIYPPTPPTARGSASEKTFSQPRVRDDESKLQSQREEADKEESKGARASEQAEAKEIRKTKESRRAAASYKSKRTNKKTPGASKETREQQDKSTLVSNSVAWVFILEAWAIILEPSFLWIQKATLRRRHPSFTAIVFECSEEVRFESLGSNFGANFLWVQKATFRHDQLQAQQNHPSPGLWGRRQGA